MTASLIFKTWLTACFEALRMRLSRWSTHREARQALARKAWRRR